MTVLHHPAVLNIPFLESYSTAAKLPYLSAVTVSDDPLIASLHSSSAFQKDNGVSLATLSLGKNSLSNINRITLPKASKAIWTNSETQKWDDHLSKLTVQNKFSDACKLEQDNKVWAKIQQGLPSGQLSFILRAASDIIPTPMNLTCWRCKSDPKCPLCDPPGHNLAYTNCVPLYPLTRSLHLAS